MITIQMLLIVWDWIDEVCQSKRFDAPASGLASRGCSGGGVALRGTSFLNLKPAPGRFKNANNDR
jgi:hypothetical protein